MTVQQAIQSRLLNCGVADRCEVAVRLPLRLKTERDPVRLKMMRRLSSSRMFALGNRSGVLRAAQNRSGRAFRLNVRQRVIVKALVSRHMGERAYIRQRGATTIMYIADQPPRADPEQAGRRRSPNRKPAGLAEGAV